VLAMKIIYYHIRGLGRWEKHGEVQKLVRDHGMSVVCLIGHGGF